MNWAGSLQVLHLVRNVPQLEGWTSALTISLLYFFRLRVFPEAQARLDAQRQGAGFTAFLSLRRSRASRGIDAHGLRGQYPARECGDGRRRVSDGPRNTKDFQPSLLPILTPEAWLALESVATLYEDLTIPATKDDQE